MYQIIAPTLFHNKVCRLPGIGTLALISHPAENDFINGMIRSPQETISFTPEHNDDKGFNEFSAISELLQKHLDDTGSYLLKGIGSFTKRSGEDIQFEPVAADPVFLPPVRAEILHREDASHLPLVGEQEATGVAMNEHFAERPPVKGRWWIWALALGAVAVCVMVYYLNRYGLNALGNVSY